MREPSAIAGTIYGVTHKTTIYIPQDLKRAIEAEASREGISEAEVIRRAIRGAISRPRPRPGIYSGEPIADSADEMLAGFGDR